MPKEYSFNGLAGCVVQRKARQTKLLVGLYQAEQAGMESDSETPWATVCETHGSIVCHPTFQIAQSHLSDPVGWCEVCSGVTASLEDMKAIHETHSALKSGDPDDQMGEIVGEIEGGNFEKALGRAVKLSDFHQFRALVEQVAQSCLDRQAKSHG